MFIDWKFIGEFGIQCVTGRTFDLVITMNDKMKSEIVEFAMIDQAEYDGVADYINRFQTLKNPTSIKAEDEQMGVEDDEEEDGSYVSGGESDDAVICCLCRLQKSSIRIMIRKGPKKAQ